jgi:PAS domain S-box-containing protein
MHKHPEMILVIDDDELFREEFQRALEDCDCEVHAHCDLESAQTDLTSGVNPSLIFADRKIRGEPIDKRLLNHVRQFSPGSHVVIYTRIDELSAAYVSELLTRGAVRVLDRSEVTDSVEKIVRECTELRELSSALDELIRGRSDLVTALVGSNVGVTMIDRQYNCWFANNRQHELIGGRCMGGLCWRLFHDQPAEAGPCWGCGIRDVLDEAISKETAIHRIILSHLRDNRVLWLSVETKPVRGSDGRVIAGTEAVSILDDGFVQNMEPTERLFGVARGLVHAGFGRVRIYEQRAETKTLKLIGAAARTDVFEARDYFSSLCSLSLEYLNCTYASKAVDSVTGILVDSWDRGDSPFKAALDLSPPYFLVPMREENYTIGLLAADFGGWDEERKPIAIRHLARKENLRWIHGYANEASRTLAAMKAGAAVVSREFFSRQQAALRARQRIAAASSLGEAIAALRDGFAGVAPDCEFCVRCRKGSNLVAEPRLVVPEGLNQREVVAIGDPESLAAYVLTTHLRPLWIEDYIAYRQGSGPFIGPRGLSIEGIRSVAHVPLCFESTIYGVLSVDSPNLHEWRKEGFVGPLTDLAEQAALVLRDIAIRDAFKEAEEAERLRVETQVLELQMIANVAEYLPLCILVKNREHVFRYVNKRFCEDVDKLRKDILGKTDVDLFGPHIARIYQKADDEVMKTGKTFEDTHERHPGACGEAHEVHVVKTPFRSPSGEIEGVVGVYWDVTETNRWFRQVQSWRDGFVQSANAIVYAHDVEGTITFVNSAASQSLGYGTEELIGKSVYDLVVPEDRDALRATIDLRRVGTGSRARDTHEFGVLAKDGRVLNLDVATSICEVEPDKKGILGVAYDVTERNQARAQLAQELERTKALRSIASGFGRAGEVSTLHRLFMLAVTHGKCLGFSRAILFLPSVSQGRFEAGLAVGPANWAAAQQQWREAEDVPFEAAVQMCLRSAASARPGDLQSQVCGLAIDLGVETDVACELHRGKPVIRRLTQPSPIRNPQFAAVIKPDNDEDVEFVLAPLREQDELKAILWADRAFLGKPKIAEGTVQHFDILWTETALMGEALHNRAQVERVAHDIARGMSYSLRTRSGILEFELALLKWTLGGEHGDAIQKMTDAIEFFKHASALATKDIRFAEMGIQNSVRLDINRVVADVVGHRQNGGISMQLCPTPLVVEMNRTHLEDIVLEVLVNALDFTKDRVEITTVDERGFVRLDVVDNGSGIHLSVRPNLFKRFKRYPEGRMGMGLAYVKSLLEAYGGGIEEIGKTGEGAHFVIRIPLQEKAAHDQRRT